MNRHTSQMLISSRDFHSNDRERYTHQRVRIEVENGRVVITPWEIEHLTLDQRLAQFDAEHHAGETMAATPVGAERV